MTRRKIFILSPADTSGKRAKLLLNPAGVSRLSRELRGRQGAALGEVFSFLSGLYFRAKLAYARAFADPPPRWNGSYIITSCCGLKLPEDRVLARDIRRYAEVPISVREERYIKPLRRDARRIAARLPSDCEVVLLGSIGTPKYLDVLTAVFGERLAVPAEFLGMGDMRRGARMLEAVRENQELEYRAAFELLEARS